MYHSMCLIKYYVSAYVDNKSGEECTFTLTYETKSSHNADANFNGLACLAIV